MVAAAVIGGMSAWLGAGPRPDAHGLTTEAIYYLKMAGWSDPDDSRVVPPWPQGLRVVTPALIRGLGALTGWGEPTLFALWNIGWSSLAAAGLFVLLRRAGWGRGPSAAGMGVWISAFYPMFYYAANPFMTDPLFLFLWVAALLLIDAGAPAWAVGLVAALGVFNKESFIFIYPYFFVRRWDARAWRRGGDVLGVVLAATATLAAYRLYAFAMGVGPIPSPIEPGRLWDWLRSYLEEPALLEQIAKGYVLGGGLLWLALPAGWARLDPDGRRRVVGGAVAVAPLLVLAIDSGRQFAILPPILVPSLLAVWSGARSDWRALAGLAIAGNVLLAVPTAVTLPGPAWVEGVIRGLGAVISLAVVALSRRGRRRTRDD